MNFVDFLQGIAPAFHMIFHTEYYTPDSLLNLLIFAIF